MSKEFPVTAGVLQRRTGSVKAVTDVSVEVRVGETFGLVGESGCGKTTIGRMMVALERPTAGRVVFEGNDLGALPSKQVRKLRSDLQLVFQDPYASLDPRMRVGAILREPLAIQAIGTRAEQRLRIEELLDEVGLGRNAAERFPHEFSGGQRQRIGLARALALSPKLIVADEPVSALDVSIRSQILNLMKRLQADHSLTYLIISHDLSVVRYMADRVGVMYLGRLVEIGTVRDVYERTAHPYTSGLLASIPVPEPAASSSGRRGRQGRAAVGARPAVGVRLPHPLPAGSADLRRRGPACRLVRRRAPGRLPLPAAITRRDADCWTRRRQAEETHERQLRLLGRGRRHHRCGPRRRARHGRRVRRGRMPGRGGRPGRGWLAGDLRALRRLGPRP